MQLLRSRLAWVLLALATILLVIAAGAVLAFVFLGQRETGEGDWQDPIAAIRPSEVAPDLALYPLAGALELDTVDAAIDNGELETAYAILVFGQDLSDAQRLGRLIRLGGRFAETERPDRAALCFQQVDDLAILHPRLSDPARADALFASGRGWAAIDEEARAVQAFDQVYTLAMESPYLQMANRRDLLVGLEAAYADLGYAERAEACRARIVELDQEARPQPPALPGEQPDLPLGTGTISSPELGELENARREAAFALLEAYAEGGEAPAAELEALSQALLAEDAAKQAFYGQELEATSQPGRRIDVQSHMIRWLLLKVQVAAGGFGLPLVPAWEAVLPSIQSDLSKAYEDLYFDYEDLVTALPQAGLIGPGRYQVRRQVMLDGRLGRYANYPARQLADKLQDAARELIAAGSAERLYVDVRSEEGKELQFFLSPADEYGLSAPTP
jgi:hypothetical protein